MLSICLLLASLAPADTLEARQTLARARPPALRQMCIGAPAVVLARPVDPLKPTRFTVAEVLRGKGVKVGDRIAAGLAHEEVESFDEPDLETKQPRPRKVTLALLFLEPAEVDGTLAPYRVRSGGYRFCTDDGRVLAPSRKGGGPVEVARGVNWAALLGTVRADLTSVDRLQSARRMARPRQRVAALTDWVQRRRGELAQVPSTNPDDLSPSGWYELTTQVFEWIFQDATPAEALAVARLYASLNRGETPRLKSPAFGSPEGRALLLETALDAKRLSADRRRALQLLASPLTLGKADGRDRAALLEKLRPALSVKDEGLQVELARTVVALAHDPGGKKATDARVINALAGAYRPAEPGPARDELAWALCRLASPEQYREVTNNPPGVCVRLAEFSHEDNEITFFLDLRTAGAKVFDQPTLVIEKLGALGVVVETTKVPLAVLNLPSPWGDGIGEAILAARLDLAKLIVLPQPTGRARDKPTATAYRLRVEGTLGKDSQKRTWRSEPKRISVFPAPPSDRLR